MRNALLWASLLAPAIAAACSANPHASTVVGEPATVLVPTEPAVAADPAEAAATNPLPILEWSIYGDTPTVAWAPDGVHLAIANQVNYLGNQDPTQAGIDVVDVTTGKRTRVFQGLGYHPVWLSNDALAFGCSPYECDKGEGLYLLRFGAQPRLIAKRGVYHTRAGKNGDVLFFSGFPEYEGWMRIDVASRATSPVKGSDDSWQPPQDALLDQCPKKVGSRRVDGRGGKVVLFDGESGQSRTLVSAQALGLAWPEDRGDIEPCLSPDGRFVVYFAQRGGDGIVGVRAIDGR